jgi:inner membrane protein
MRFPFLGKLAAVGGVGVALLIPLGMTQGKITERQELNNQARRSIAEASAGAQRIVLPVIEHLCRETWTVEKTVRVNERDQVLREPREREVGCGRVVADALQVSGSIEAEAEPRRRGIFSARLYTARLHVSGKLKLTEPDLSGPHRRSHLGTFFAIDLTSVQGIKNASALTLGAQRIEFRPGVRLPVLQQGIHAALPALKPGEATDFSFDLDLLGMENFSLGPLAKQTSIKLGSNWPHPGFSGNFLPDTKSIRADGFEAAWSMNEFAVQAAQPGKPGAPDSNSPQHAPVLGIGLVEPVNVYLQSYRSVQYGFLFVGLTFLLVLVYELAGAARVHPMQYGLIGLALAVFFLLLIALAEHVGFMRAYLGASLACVGLLTWYAIGVLGGWARGLSVGASCSALFGVLYVLLRSEDHALLLGALLVFTILAALMLASRRLDWYGLGARLAALRD